MALPTILKCDVEKSEGPMIAITARLGARRLHYAWVIIALTFVVIVVTAGVRATPGVLIVREVFKVVTSARDEGISILLVEQNVRAATEIADRAYVLDDGAIIYSGSAAELANDEERVRSMAGASAKEWATTDH